MRAKDNTERVEALRGLGEFADLVASRAHLLTDGELDVFCKVFMRVADRLEDIKRAKTLNFT